MHPRLVCFLLATVLTSAAAQAGSCDFSAITTRTQQLMQGASLSNAGVVIGSARGIVFKHYWGDYSDATIIPLASATKMLSAVRIMQLVDQGRIDLDTPVAAYLPEFIGTKGTMTMRQMFSHTAGYGNDENNPVLAARNITLSEAAARIACCIAMPYPPPGSFFTYGGISMQVGGRVAEVQGNEDWQAGWIEHIATPLGITSIDWQGLGATSNYRISGSGEASLPDYSKVLAMLAGGGVGNGYRLVSANAIATLNHDQTGGAPWSPGSAALDGNPLEGIAYGIGAWIEGPSTSVSVDQPVISSTGKFGYTPWVDFSNATFGIIMVEDHDDLQPDIGQRSRGAMADIIDEVRTQLGPDCPMQETYDEIFRDGLGGSTP